MSGAVQRFLYLDAASSVAMLTDRPATEVEVDLTAPKLLPRLKDLTPLYMSAVAVNSGTLGFGDARTVTCSALILDPEAYAHTVMNRLPTWISITNRHSTSTAKN